LGVVTSVFDCAEPAVERPRIVWTVSAESESST
jgi:hypothetical protein